MEQRDTLDSLGIDLRFPAHDRHLLPPQSEESLRRPAVKAKYLLPCPCGRQIPVLASQAGQQLQCECGASLEVPSMRGLAELEPVGPSPDAGSSAAASPDAMAPKRVQRTSRGRGPVWGTRQRLLLIGAVITTVGVGMGAYFHVFRPRQLDAEGLAPIQTWNVWRDLSHGIDQRPAWESDYLEFLASYRRWMIVAGAITGIGVIVMGGSLLAPRSRRKRRARRPPPRRVGSPAGNPRAS